jgi:hypothetical protein
LVSGLQKCYTELNLVTVTVLWHSHLFVGLKPLYWRCYVGNWLCSEESYCTDKYLVFCDKHTAINILKFQGRMFGFCLFGRTRFKWGNIKYSSSAWLLHLCCSWSQRLKIFITQFGVLFLGYILGSYLVQFSWDNPIFIGFNDVCPSGLQNLVQGAKYPMVSKS